TQSSEDLRDILNVINHTSEPKLPQTLEQVFNVDAFLKSMTVDALMSNSYVEDSESYFIHDHVTGKWTYVPWDLNNVDARWWYTYSLDAKPIVSHSLFNFTATDTWIEKIYAARKDLYPGYLPVFSNLGTRVVLNWPLRARLIKTLETALGTVYDVPTLHGR